MATQPYNFANSLGSMFSSLGLGASSPAIPNIGGNSTTFNAGAALAGMAPKSPVSPFMFSTANSTPVTGRPVVPNMSVAPSANTGGMSYQIQPGDTIDKIAAAHGLSASALLAANPSITNPNLIRAGAALNLPGTTRPAIPSIPGTTPSNVHATTSTPSLAGHPAIPTTDGSGTVNANTGSYTPTTQPLVSSDTSGGGSSPTIPNSTYSGATSALLAANATNPADTGVGVSGYEQAVQDLSDFEKKLTGQRIAIGSQPIPMPFIQGQEQVAATENAGLLAALTGNVTQAQQGIGFETQGRTAQNTGLQEAGALTQPVANASYFGTPETGNVIGSDFGAALDQYAEMAANGQYSAIPASITGNPILSAQVNAKAKAINPNYSPITSAATGAATAQNTTLAGTATPTAENTIYQKALSDYQDLQQNVANVDQFGSLLTSGMTASDGTEINPTQSKYANMTIAQFRNQLSSPQQAQFDSTYAALKGKISGMLSIGGSETPTTLSNDAAGVLDGSAPIGTLTATLSRIQTEGNTLLGNQANKVNTAKANITPPSTNFGTSNNGGGGSSNPFSSANFFGGGS